MADDKKFDIAKYYKDLNKLFKGGIPVYQKIAHKIAAPGDTSMPIGTARGFLQHTNNAYTTAIANYGAYNRMARYSDYQSMESMAEIGSALSIYAEEACVKDENGDLIQIHSENKSVRDALKVLFYDTLNLEFNASAWIRNMVKYGDQFLMVDHHPDYGVMGVLPLPVNEIEREEGYDPNNPLAYRYRWVTQGGKVLNNWQIIHFRMTGNDQFYPYGCSLLEPARRTWRQLILMEDAVMVYRIVRSPERRVFYIGVGNIDPKDIPTFIEKAKTQLKRSQIMDSTTSRVDLRYNPLSAEEDYFIPVRGEGDGTRIETLPGGQYTGDIEDLQYIQNKLFAALRIPKSYLGYEGDVSSKSVLSQEDVRFARTIQMIQRIFVAELNKIAVLHLYAMGLRGDELINFELGMASPSTIAELQRLELWRSRLEVASIAQEGMFDRHFIYQHLFHLSNEEIEAIEEGKRKDRLYDLGLETVALSEPYVEEEPPPVEEPEVGEPVSATPDAGTPIQPTVPSPEAGLPPPPGESATASGQGLETSGRDPNKQVAAPNELIHVEKPFTKEKIISNLYNYVFNMKKTAMDPKRSYSELTRAVKAPFGESREERMFKNKQGQIRKFAAELESLNIGTLNKVLKG